MYLLVVRHAIAEERARGQRDDDRALTGEGRERMRRAARGLARIVETPGVLAASPLKRARQTAEILSEAFGGCEIATLERLRPDTEPAELAPWISRQEGIACVVGHEPHLSRLVEWLTGGGVELKKGAAALVEVDSATARLRWLLQPYQLRLLGRRR